jgi:hypothetical protein
VALHCCGNHACACRYDGAQPLNDLWELELKEILHASEASALDYFPVDSGTGMSWEPFFEVTPTPLCPLFVSYLTHAVSAPIEDSVVLPALGYSRRAGVVAGMGTGTNSSTYNITGFGTSTVVEGVKPSPGGGLIDMVYQFHCGYRNTNSSGADAEWRRGCAATSSAQPLCGLDAVLLRAWCSRQYQSLGSV